jgi:hypothetical protein
MSGNESLPHPLKASNEGEGPLAAPATAQPRPGTASGSNNPTLQNGGTTSPLPPRSGHSPVPNGSSNLMGSASYHTPSKGPQASPSLIARPRAMTAEGRNVSWQLSDGNPSPFHSPTPSMSSQTKKYNLRDVLASGQVESEAETYVLRAVEKLTAGHMRKNTETSRLFQTIADDELTREIGNDDLSSVSSHIQKQQPPVADRQKSGGDSTSFSVADAPPAGAGGRPALTKGKSYGKAKFKGLVKKHLLDDKKNNVEQTLFGLANALNELNGQGAKTGVQKDRNTSVMGTYGKQLRGMDKIADTVGNAMRKEKGGDVEEGGAGIKSRHFGPATTIAEGSEHSDTTDDDTNSVDANNDSSTKPDGTPSKKSRKKKRGKGAKFVNAASEGLKADWDLFNEFLGGKKASMKAYARSVFLFIMIPAILLSGLLFYFVEKPEVEEDEDGNLIVGQDATASWWILFLGCRVVVTFTMALITQALIIDWLALGSRFSLRWFGPIVTLLVVQVRLAYCHGSPLLGMGATYN